MVKAISVHGLEGIPLIECGDDLATLILSAAENNGVQIEDGDIIVIAQKVISKAEGRVVEIEHIKASERALNIAGATGRDPRLVELVLRESKRFLKVSQQTLIVEDQRGIVNINAGIDKSNIRGASRYALLPVDPDKSARVLQSRIEKKTGRRVGVIVSDTYSRAFRRGQVNFAIGLAGFCPIVDYRGKPDLFGYTMRVKFSASADELAGAAELVMGQGEEAVPVAIVKGFGEACSRRNSSSRELLINENEDLFKDVW